MNPLARLERFFERVMEGTFTTLLGSPLEPVELAQALVRAMEAQRAVGPGKILVPNRYLISLHPEDFALFAPYRETMERELASYLLEEARQRGLTIVPRPWVRLCADERVPRRRPQITAELVDEPTLPSAALAPVNKGATVALQPLPVAASAVPRATLFVGGDERRGRAVPITQVPFAIGRSLDNGLPLEDLQVSRHHAEIRLRQRRLCVVDLNSRNGTYVNGERVEQCLLSDGDVITIGTVPLLFRLEEGPSAGSGHRPSPGSGRSREP